MCAERLVWPASGGKLNSSFARPLREYAEKAARQYRNSEEVRRKLADMPSTAPVISAKTLLMRWKRNS